MPNRILREGILSSDRVNQLDAPAEVFYRRLMSKVDDHGLFDARPAMLRSSLFPLRVDRVREADIPRWIAECEKAGLIALYVHDGKPYGQMLDTKWQARSEPKHPIPPWGAAGQPPPAASTCAQPRTGETGSAQPPSAAPVFGVEVEVETVGGKSRKRATPSPKTAMPEGFGVSDRVRAWAAEKGFGQLDEHLDAFRRKVAAKSYTYADWDAAFMEAVREDWAKLRGRGPNGAAPPPESAAAGPWHETPAGVSAKGVELGLGAWSETEWHAGRCTDYPTYRARVFKAAGFSPRAAA